ncbi:hypothetical protein [Mycobacterium shigaense]|uniref:hypothetical protein n=1 Tax=Mycobacterium shigaense TaxID=722731 RepID=UPI0013C32181|nr:hypothetical protein [Mycobacterium shigaense]
MRGGGAVQRGTFASDQPHLTARAGTQRRIAASEPADIAGRTRTQGRLAAKTGSAIHATESGAANEADALTNTKADALTNAEARPTPTGPTIAGAWAATGPEFAPT